MESFRGNLYWADYSEIAFNDMVIALSKLNVKYLQQLLSDLKEQPINSPFRSIHSQHQRLIGAVEHAILEKTVLNG